MKKAVTIFLTILYLSSFSGVLLAMDCRVHQPLTTHAADAVIGCTATAHSQDNEGHPLLQFCKLVEVHQEILVTASVKKFHSTPGTLVSTNHILFSVPPLCHKPVRQSILNVPGKLFINHCVWLI